MQIELWSLWCGKDEWEGLPVRRYPFFSIFRVIFFKIPLWAWRRPGALRRVWAAYMSESSPSLLNIGENLLGLAFALDKADFFRADPPALFHAVWGTMPAAAAWLLHEITGIPFSMGAHAYDIFRDGGDWTLRQKLARARFIHTTTSAARHRLLELGANQERTRLIRRGLDALPAFTRRIIPSASGVTHLLSIGRLVQKKGFNHQLEIYRALRTAGMDFEARIIGEGPLFDELRRRITTLGLTGYVTLTGSLEYADVLTQYAWADVFIFTGVIADDGDRDGLPNVIPEAMAHGLPVVTTPVSGTTEAIVHDVTGQVVDLADHAAWVRALLRLCTDHAFVEHTCLEARRWVEREFSAQTNATHLAEALARVVTTDK
jgi:glycosyltransferase involved in cell wall biosynthesis